MTTLSHEPRTLVPQRRLTELLVHEIAASVAISVMWLAVLFDAIWGPNIENSTAGGNHSSVPSAVVVALFAFLGSWAVARYAFRRGLAD